MGKLDKTTKYIFGTISALIALYLSKVFWVWFALSFGTIIGVFFTLVWLGYIYIAVNLVTLKKWAYDTFFFIIGLAILIEILLILMEGLPDNLIEGLSHCIFWVSLVVIPVFGISALIRKILKRSNKK